MNKPSPTTAPLPWAVERWSDGKSGPHGISIKAADGTYIANMVADCFHDRELANARLIVKAVNQHAAHTELAKTTQAVADDLFSMANP